MSESSFSDEEPSRATLEQALRDVVQQVYKTGNLEELTVKRVRIAAEKFLNLKDGFYKSEPTWNQESKRIIRSEVEAHTDVKSVGEPSSSQASPKFKASPMAKGPKQATDLNRSSTTASVSKKRKKQETDEEIPGEEKHKAVIKRPVAKSRKTWAKSSTPEKDPVAEIEPALEGNAVDDIPAPESESEMSVVIDEQPKRKGKARGTGSGKSRSNKAPASKGSKRGSDKPIDADAEEIKRLKGWLIKCGIRKMWFRELAPYDSPKLKIKHLKGLLNDAGMIGRYSIEKAAQIRNERELKADLEALQEDGRRSVPIESDDEEPAKPRRRLARGLIELDFLNGSNGEETD